MCTVSLVSSPDGSALRLLMNRDERRLRPVAVPPGVHRTGTGVAVWPTDPVSGGTWVAATDAGLLLAVMNVDGRGRTPGTSSRGLLIPMLAGARSIDEAIGRWNRIDRSAFAPFRLIVASRERVAVFNAAAPVPSVLPIGPARVFASSGYGDAHVEALRAELLASLLRTEADPWRAQSRFHQHAWPDRRHLSVMMARVEACTVSQTEVVMTSGAVSLHYRPVADGWPMPGVHRTLTMVGAPARAA